MLHMDFTCEAPNKPPSCLGESATVDSQLSGPRGTGVPTPQRYHGVPRYPLCRQSGSITGSGFQSHFTLSTVSCGTSVARSPQGAEDEGRSSSAHLSTPTAACSSLQACTLSPTTFIDPPPRTLETEPAFSTRSPDRPRTNVLASASALVDPRLWSAPPQSTLQQGSVVTSRLDIRFVELATIRTPSLPNTPSMMNGVYIQAKDLS